MENYSYSSYPDSVNSSPRSLENPSWDEQPPSNYKVKLLCSYGGKIQPRPHDNQLTYIGGDTKILAVDRHIKFINLVIKLSSVCDRDISFKYQLPGEDLDALISVTNDEDLDHMMLEYDRLCKSSPKPARLRLFLFNLKPVGSTSSFGSTESKSERQWFVDALNSANLEAVTEQPPPPMTPVTTSETPDYLFGLEDKAQDMSTQNHPAPPPVNDDFQGREIHRQIEELQRLQISDQDQSPRYYQQTVTPPPPQQAGYWQDRQVQGGPYSHPQTDQPVYLIQTPAGIYQAPPVHQMTGQVGQGYYGMQRMVPEVYREQQVYKPVPQQNQQQQQQQMYTGAYNTEAVGFMPPPPEPAYSQVYYTTPGGMMVAPPIQAVSAAGATRFIPTNQGIAAGVAPGFNPEGKGASKVSQPPSM